MSRGSGVSPDLQHAGRAGENRGAAAMTLRHCSSVQHRQDRPDADFSTLVEIQLGDKEVIVPIRL